METKISVVVPIYGVEKYLRQCLDSIVGQSFSDLEIILVDDGGKDGCPAIIDEYAVKDERIVALHCPNGGYGKAVNRGIERANGDWIAIVEPDDWLNLDAYERLVAFTTQDVDIVKGDFAHVFPDGHSEKWCKWNVVEGELDWNDRAEFLKAHPSVWSCLYRAQFLNDYNIRMHEVPGAGWVDNPFQLETFTLARKIVYVDAVIYNYRTQGNDEPIIIKGDWKTIFDRSTEMCQWLDAHQELPKCIAAAIYERGFYYAYLIARMAKCCGYWRISRVLREFFRMWNPDVMHDRSLMSEYEQHMHERYLHHPLLMVMKQNNRWYIMSIYARVRRLFAGIKAKI